MISIFWQNPHKFLIAELVTFTFEGWVLVQILPLKPNTTIAESAYARQILNVRNTLHNCWRCVAKATTFRKLNGLGDESE